MALLSVIIPVYNAASFLCQCLDSICSQTLEDIEIICVDDCSTDNSASILESYRERDARVRLIRQEKNSGPGAARNKGISVAGGDYVGFVDSDDWIEKDYFESMVSVAASSGADLLFNSSLLLEMPETSEPFVWLGSPTVSEEGLYLDNGISANYTNPAMYSHLYRRELLAASGCLCPVDYNIGEDKYFHIVSSMRAKSVYAYAGPVYHYRQTRGSLTLENNLYNVNTVRFFRDLVNYFGDEIYDPSFALKLYNKDMFSRIDSNSEYEQVKGYLESLSPYFERSGVFLSDFDRYVIGNMLESDSLADMLRRIGREPWIRYTTMERIRRRRNVKVSIIIPVGNAQADIERCLRSICNQSLRDIEIICVNEGSSDRSFDIIRHFAFEDNRMRIVDNKDLGVSGSTKELALKNAAGKYYHIFGIEDSPDEDFLETMLSDGGLHSI